eukprot:4754424-Alexandrium_andersonii.AAC.1
MSASLVGSEMCIRDRHSLSAAARATRRSRFQSARAARAAAKWCCHASSACLLYTSDAADDM